MDLRVHAGVQQPEKLSPRQIVHMHGLVMDSLRRDLAMRAQATMMACSVGFNGDKKGAFPEYLEGLMARPVFRRIDAEEKPTIRSVEDDEEAENFALEWARKQREKGS